VSGGALLLERLVSNLLDNAERYNVTGGTVSVSTTTSNGVSHLRVVNYSCRLPGSTTAHAMTVSVWASRWCRPFLPSTRTGSGHRHPYRWPRHHGPAAVTRSAPLATERVQSGHIRFGQSEPGYVGVGSDVFWVPRPRDYHH
jgi:hypothetical protein